MGVNFKSRNCLSKIKAQPTWQNWLKLQVHEKLEFSIQNWGKLQVKLEFCHVGVLSVIGVCWKDSGNSTTLNRANQILNQSLRPPPMSITLFASFLDLLKDCWSSYAYALVRRLWSWVTLFLHHCQCELCVWHVMDRTIFRENDGSWYM